jgi:hypothetical protein
LYFRIREAQVGTEKRTVQVKRTGKTALLSLTAILAFSLIDLAATSREPAEDASPSAAICPIVYRLDQSPSSRGYHYTFFGNAFFINEQGYLLTVAHVLETFRNGGQPYILVNRPDSPPTFLQLTVVVADPAHEVAILRASPNPFAGKFKVAFLALSQKPAARGQSVLALSLHPAHLRNPQSLEAPVEDRSTGEILSFESTQLEKSAPAAEVFLLSHPVKLGQSGSPVLALDSHAGAGAVVGLVEGRWLRDSPALLTNSSKESDPVPGAAIPIEYAIALLERHNISWHKPANP